MQAIDVSAMLRLKIVNPIKIAVSVVPIIELKTSDSNAPIILPEMPKITRFENLHTQKFPSAKIAAKSSIGKRISPIMSAETATVALGSSAKYEIKANATPKIIDTISPYTAQLFLQQPQLYTSIIITSSVLYYEFLFELVRAAPWHILMQTIITHIRLGSAIAALKMSDMPHTSSSRVTAPMIIKSAAKSR